MVPPSEVPFFPLSQQPGLQRERCVAALFFDLTAVCRFALRALTALSPSLAVLSPLVGNDVFFGCVGVALACRLCFLL